MAPLSAGLPLNCASVISPKQRTIYTHNEFTLYFVCPLSCSLKPSYPGAFLLIKKILSLNPVLSLRARFFNTDLNIQHWIK